MATTAIVMTLLGGLIGISLEVTAVRGRAAELQRTADAAALAGATALPDLARAQTLADGVLQRNDPGGNASLTLEAVPGKPGRIRVVVNDPNSGMLILKNFDVRRQAQAEQSVGIPMGTPYNSIGTGDLPGTVPGNPTAIQGYFLAVNGPCTAKEDGDRFMALFDGTRGSLAGNPATQNTDAYHCGSDGRAGRLWNQGDNGDFSGTSTDQWTRNTEHTPGGYSYFVNVPCDGGLDPCPSGTPISNGVYIDVWDPWFYAWLGEPPCPVADRSTVDSPTCVVDKVPIADPDRNWVSAGLGVNFTATHFAIYAEQADGSFSSTPMYPAEVFTSSDVKWAYDEGINDNYACRWDVNKWTNQRRNGNAPQFYCKDWFALHTAPITRSGRYRVQVMADPAAAPLRTTAAGFRWDDGRSYSMNVYSLRTRRANQTPVSWTPCSTVTSTDCSTITGEGALSVYVRTPGTADLFLSRMAPATDYRGRTVQVQLWDPGEGASNLKVLMPVPVSVDPSGWISVPFTYSTGSPGLADYQTDALVTDQAVGWSSGLRTPVAVAAASGLDVSGTYSALTPPWSPTERYSQARFNGRLVLIDVAVPESYGKDASGNTVADSEFGGGWWKIRYTSGAGVEDRTTWVVTSGSGPVHLTRSG